MHMTELLSQLKLRARTLKLIDQQTGYIDDVELEAYVVNAMEFLASKYQLQHFMELRQELVRTQADVQSYALPSHYSFIAPLETRRSGISITEVDVFNPVDMQYYDPTRFQLLANQPTGKPFFFTFLQGLMYLQPVPNDVYLIQAILRPLQDGTNIPDPYVPAIKIQTLCTYASDKERLTNALEKERVDTLMPLVNNEHRFRQRFTRERSQWQSHRYRR